MGEVAGRLIEVGLVGWSGLDLLTLSSSDFGPEADIDHPNLPCCTTTLTMW
jgi:hypothetical protein